MTTQRAASAMVAFVFLAGAVSARAQSEGTIRGQAVSAADGLAIGRSTATLKPVSGGETAQTVIHSQSGTDGWFGFPNVRPGEYILSISSEGFDVRAVRFVLAPREVKTLTIPMDIARVAERVEVSGDLDVIPGTHSPSSTTLTADRLETTPVFQRLALSDAIVTLAPGMIRGHDDFVHIRGHEVALNPLINGVSFWENTHAVFSAGLSPDVIETANVMTGGFSAEYGNRFGGVVDIVTRSGFRMESPGAVTVSTGNAARRRLGAEFGGSRGRVGYFMYGSAFESDRFLSPPDPEAIHDRARGGHTFVQLDGSFGRFGLVRAIAMGDGTDVEIPVTPQDVALRPLATPRQETRQQTAIVSWMNMLGNSAVSASLYQRSSRVQLFPAAGPLTAQAELDRRLSTLGIKGDATRFVGRHTLKAGVDAARLRPREVLAYNDAGYLAFTHLIGLPHVHVAGEAIAFRGDDSGGQVSAFIQDGIQAGSHVTIDVGVRVDRYDLLVARTHASGRVNLAVRIAERTVLHASYNQFFVPPSVEGILSSSAGLTKSIEEINVALPPLEPTVEHQIEAGVTTTVGSLQVAATSYFRATDNPVHTTVWPDSRIYSYASFDRARAYGLEAKAELRSPGPSGLTGYLNYALGRVYFYNPVTGGFVTDAGHLTDTSRFQAPMDQLHTLSGGVTYRHAASGLWFGTAIEYGSGTPMGHGGAHHHATGGAEPALGISGATPVLPGHVTLGASGGINLLRSASRRPRLTVQVDLENIANDIYVIAQEGEFAPAQYSIPRLLSVTAKFHF